MIAWDPSYEVGIAAIDGQHREMVDIANRLLEGLRASNSSATRGRPPVMSRVFDTSCGIRASTSPTATCWPSRTAITAPTGKLMFTAWSVPAMHTSSPRSFSSFTDGRTPLAAALPRRLTSITTRVERPVTSSICLATDEDDRPFAEQLRSRGVS